MKKIILIGKVTPNILISVSIRNAESELDLNRFIGGQVVAIFHKSLVTSNSETDRVLLAQTIFDKGSQPLTLIHTTYCLIAFFLV